MAYPIAVIGFYLLMLLTAAVGAPLAERWRLGRRRERENASERAAREWAEAAELCARRGITLPPETSVVTDYYGKDRYIYVGPQPWGAITRDEHRGKVTVLYISGMLPGCSPDQATWA
jgi:hypothetical protein